MKKKIIALIALLLVLGLSGAASAGLINGGFETGDLTGWSGSASVVSSAQTYDGTNYGPVEGNYFAVVTAGAANTFINISQAVALNVGDVLEGHALFDGRDYINDYGAVRIYDSLSNLVATPWYRDISQVGNYGHTNWEEWSWTATAADTYTLALGVANYGDSILSSRAFFDANEVQAVPIPGAVWLLGSGLVGLLGLRRKF
jgi:hypothetical protein